MRRRASVPMPYTVVLYLNYIVAVYGVPLDSRMTDGFVRWPQIAAPVVLPNLERLYLR
jgi:hypothetical protein